VQPWRRHRWARAISALITEHNRKARGKQRVPQNASAYSFRHSRISELLQVYGIDPLTVARQTGTSLAMIEKAYFRFIPSAMKGKLEAARYARRCTRHCFRARVRRVLCGRLALSLVFQSRRFACSRPSAIPSCDMGVSCHSREGRWPVLKGRA